MRPYARTFLRYLAVLLTFPLLALATACGASQNTGGQAAGAASTTNVAKAAAFVKQYMNTDERALPTSAPRPQRGKKVWIISCSQAAEACQHSTNGMVEAGRLVGWDTTIFDGKGDPANYSRGVRTAVASKADAIVLVAVDCSAVKAPLQEARQAGVKIFSIYSVDCNQPFGGGGARLFDGQVDWGPKFGSMAGSIENSFARLMAEYTIWKTNGKANIIAITEDDLSIVHQTYVGYLRWIKTDCPSCKVTELPIAFSDLLQGKLQAKVSSVLTQNPQANVVMAPYDALVVGGVAAAVQGSGRDKQILLTGGEGFAANVQMIRNGTGQDFAAGAPSRWAGFAAVDQLNRLFHGQPTVDEGIGQAVIDKDHNLPTKTPFYDGKADYEANFRKIWGVK
ncbi:sugar ABC transporter substrate-binding protein [Streptomyces sp. NPDC101225]|uniref:sugar ABC transporter substrate-binding protein n=1 Tax=Streptomyces sp. NPDC101225 TaxID=3366135 RepID=UPI0037F64134